MDERQLAGAWLEDTLARAREAIAERPLGPRDQPWEAYETGMRALVEATVDPPREYVGLRLPEAEQLAARLHHYLCVHRGPTGHRANWQSHRVHVEVDADNVVVAARRDRALWADYKPRERKAD